MLDGGRFNAKNLVETFTVPRMSELKCGRGLVGWLERVRREIKDIFNLLVVHYQHKIPDRQVWFLAMADKIVALL